MYINFRTLNVIIKKNDYLLLRIQECLDLINRIRYLSKIDFIQDYY